MNIQNNYHPRKLNSPLLVILYIILGIYSCFAQGKQRISVIGIEVSVGSHRFLVEDQVFKLKNISALTKGLSGGIYFGNNLVNLRIRGGYFLSPRKVQFEMHVAEFDMLLDVHPLEFIRSRSHVLDIYLTAGYSHHWLKINGNLNSYQDVDLSASDLPKKGNYQVVGMGLKFIPRIGKRRTQFFAEVLVCNALNKDKGEINALTNIGFKRILKWTPRI